MIEFLSGLFSVVGTILLVIVGFFAVCLLIFVPAMIARKCGTGIKTIITALYFIVGFALVCTIFATPLAVLLVKQACTTIWDKK